MLRARSLLLAILLLAASLAWTPARADAPLVADAGDSRVAYNGQALALRGTALGGVAPYAFHWSWDGDASRLLDADSANATFDAAGLPPQDIVFTLRVTDAAGAVASDTVRHRLDDAPTLLRRNVSVTFGVPDELAEGGMDARQVSFTVPPGLARLVATLDWDNGAAPYDLDVELYDPSGAQVAGSQGSTDRKPERVVVDAPAAGAWRARILPFLSGQTTARLEVQGFPAGALPRVAAGGPYAFGSLDPQRLAATATGGAEPIALAWDLDGDGAFESPGAEVLAALPVGEHQVRVRATDAVGYEVSAYAGVSVREADTILRLRCGGDPATPYWSMEYTSTKNTCWVHGGHHTYFTGDARFAVRRVTGSVFSVEQQFSPPTEHSLESPGATPIHLQVSEDGLAWTELEGGEYRFLPDVLDGQLAIQTRQRVAFVAPGDGQPFRFVRLHQPLSLAQGLSGYLDHSEVDVEADVLPTLPSAAPEPGVRALDCRAGDVMEDFFAAHPCWFGGIDRYDAPSFWHTYVVGDHASLDRVRGEFTLAPWRLDDWNQGNATANATGVAARVQVSVDGVQWRDVAEVRTVFGASTPFDVALADEPARFVRLFPEYHARYDETARFAPNHHPKGYFLDSRVTIEGLLPVA